jgi:putative ABC transport system ATP-binding protein
MPAAGTVILEARQLSKSFRIGTAREVRALQEVSMSIAAGSFCALTGPSGCGKTTLLALLGALERPTSGQVLFQGRDLSVFSDVELARARRHMGFVFQDFSLVPALRVWENITYPLIPRGVPRADRYAKAQALLERFTLADRLLARPKELSGGEQQRVALARALAGDPAIIFADEPTSNLDPEAAAIVLSLLQVLHAEGRTIILATHEPRALELATNIYELHKGKLIQADFTRGAGGESG